MNHAATNSTPAGKRPPDISIAWEAPPSRQHLVERTDAAPRAGDAPTWAATMPASLEAMYPPASFREPLNGLSVSDIDEPEVFEVFFGDAAPPQRRAA